MTGSSRARAAGLAFLTAAVTLFLQVLVHRMVSAKLLNNYAFLVISLTMLGFALSGIILTRWLGLFLTKLNEILTACAALFVLSALVASTAFYHADTGPLAATRDEFIVALLRLIPYALLYTVPFVFCGLILGILLTAREFPTRQIYCWTCPGLVDTAVMGLGDTLLGFRLVSAEQSRGYQG